MSTALLERPAVPKIRQTKLLIDNQWVDPIEGKSFSTINPATGESIAEVAEATAKDVDRAVKAARRALEDGPWSRTDAADRGRMLLKLADLVEANAEELAALESLNCGKTITDSRGDIQGVANTLRYYGGWADKIEGRTIPVRGSFLSYTLRQPVGVVGQIIPWNFPLLMLAWKWGPALACGNAVVMKPAEQTPLSALRLGELALEAGFPSGVINLLNGYGETAGNALVVHPDVDKIAFTGHVDTAKIIQKNAADTLKRVTFELGGKSPNIVFADADLAEAVPGTALGIFGNQGEVCSAGSRIFVQRPVYDEVLAGLVDEAKALTLGSGLDPDVTMGPLVSAAQRERVEGYIGLGKQQGARLAFEGARPEDPALAGGFFVPPTVFETESLDLTIAREEIFGPVATVVPFDEVDEVTRMANDTEYGLAAAIWTRDIGKAFAAAKAVRAGVVWINDSQPAPSEASWGGFKQSGIGRELGPYGLEAFLESKQIYVKL